MPLHQTWTVRKPQVSSSGGVVAAQHYEAAGAGATILREGGNAMDAAVATAAALSVVEPWLSGFGGGGFLLHASADGQVDALDFNMRALKATDGEDYPLADGEDGDWFNWPSVKDNRNLMGPWSICVPGAVAGLSQALERYGSMSWQHVLQPAIALADRGMRVDWFAELAFTIDRDGLSANEHAANLFLSPKNRTFDPREPSVSLLPMPDYARMLRGLAERGARDFYEGQIAEQLVTDLHAAGSKICPEDLSDYQAVWSSTARAPYRDRVIHTMPGLSGGPSMLAAFSELEAHDMQNVDEATFASHHANAIRNAYTSRLKSMGHAAAGDDCTTHLSVVDRTGNMVSLTNTLLSRFGSKVVAPSLGLTMNNGMMWFDPRPGQPNSIAAGATPLSNMSPAITTLDGKPEIAIGAAGGRQIFPAVAQLLSRMIDRQESPDAAIHAPRIDASTPTVIVSNSADGATAAAIAKHHPVHVTTDSVHPVQFAIPSIVQSSSKDVPNVGVSHPNSPWAAACSEDD